MYTLEVNAGKIHYHLLISLIKSVTVTKEGMQINALSIDRTEK